MAQTQLTTEIKHLLQRHVTFREAFETIALKQAVAYFRAAITNVKEQKLQTYGREILISGISNLEGKVKSFMALAPEAGTIDITIQDSRIAAINKVDLLAKIEALMPDYFDLMANVQAGDDGIIL